MRTNTKPRVEDYVVIGNTLERIVRVTTSTKGKTKGQTVAVTIKRRVPLQKLSFIRKLNSRFFYSLA